MSTKELTMGQVEEVIAQAEAIVNRRQAAAGRLGVEASEVEVRRLELAQMREAGLLVDLDIHGTSMFTVRASYAEMGISANDVRTERLRAGSKDLFPGYSKQLRSLEARARQNLYAHSFKIAAFGQWSWVPWTAYEAFKEKNDEIVAQLAQVKAEIIARYDELRETNRVYFEMVAERAWKDLMAGYAPGDKVVIVTTDGLSFEDKARFVEYVVQRALSKMPLPEEIEAVVRIDYRTSILYTEGEIEAENAAIAAARAVQAQAYAEEAEARQAAYEARLQERIAKSEAEAKIEAFKKAELEHARQQLAAMGSPLQEALDGLRANLYGSVQSLLEGVRKNGGFRGQASVKAAELHDFWQKLNGGLLKDDDLDASLKALDAEMKKYSSANREAREASIGDITSQLAEIATLTAESARRIQNHDSRASSLEL